MWFLSLLKHLLLETWASRPEKRGEEGREYESLVIWVITPLVPDMEWKSLRWNQPLVTWVSLAIMDCMLYLQIHMWVQQFSSVAQSCPTLCTPWTAARQASLSINNSQSLLKLMSIKSVMPSNHHPQSSPSPPALNLSQHQGLFQWVSSLHLVAKVLEFQFQHQSFQCIFRTDFLYIDNKKTQTLQRRKDSQKLWKVDFRRGSQCLTVLVI